MPCQVLIIFDKYVYVIMVKTYGTENRFPIFIYHMAQNSRF
jgi:hypothetical protein